MQNFISSEVLRTEGDKLAVSTKCVNDWGLYYKHGSTLISELVIHHTL